VLITGEVLPEGVAGAAGTGLVVTARVLGEVLPQALLATTDTV
jgi:hypothetical protein